MGTAETLKPVAKWLDKTGLFTPLSETQKFCDKHGVEYTERIYLNFTEACPQCAQERKTERLQAEARAKQAQQQRALMEQIDKRIGKSRIPLRFQSKTVKSYEVRNEEQAKVVERIKAYAKEFALGKHSERNLVLLGNPGTGKTHLACAVGNHIMRNCGGQARFSSVAEINRLMRQAKSYDSDVSESEVIEAFGQYDLLIIDEVGVQSGTEAESRALFDVFNERYQNMKPTILISNLDVVGFVASVGERIADRIKEDGGEFLFFNWQSAR